MPKDWGKGHYSKIKNSGLMPSQFFLRNESHVNSFPWNKYFGDAYLKSQHLRGKGRWISDPCQSDLQTEFYDNKESLSQNKREKRLWLKKKYILHLFIKLNGLKCHTWKAEAELEIRKQLEWTSDLKQQSLQYVWSSISCGKQYTY